MTENEKRAQAYYLCMSEKNIEKMGEYLHPDVQFMTPLMSITGKENVLEGAKFFLPSFKTLTVRATCGSGDQIMMAYDLDFPLPVGILRVAALLTFKENLIGKIELFFDARSFEKKED